jgi:ATP-dependent Lhr-like helicase
VAKAGTRSTCPEARTTVGGLRHDGGVSDVLDRFSTATRSWFGETFAAPTDAQADAWGAISSGANALVVAPTGSGKTLAAFLWAIDRLTTASPVADASRRCRVVYVSPLKALAVDVERNLRVPMRGIARTATRLGTPARDVEVAVRSGDTPADQRRRFATKPSDILITTPESLFLLLTSRAREALRGVDTVIVDEVHSVAGTKRGAHLAVSLERLDALVAAPAQRIGLSATVRPVDRVATFLSGSARVQVVAPPAPKEWDLSVVVPVEDMTALGGTSPSDGSGGSDDAAPRKPSIWPHVEEHIVDLIEAHRSTIVFANSRRVAERLTARLNEIAAERAGADLPLEPEPPAQVMAQSGASRGAVDVIARAHHGSVSKEQRKLIEEDLKAGRLPCVVATSSLELGIDMGAVDLVVQVETPPSIASGVQRVGRAGHQVGETSRGVFFPTNRSDLLRAAVALERIRSGAIEELDVPANPLDVLAQQTIAAAAMDTLDVDTWYATVRRAAPFAELPRSAYDATLELLAGRYPSDEFAGLRPRLVWDRTAGTVTGRPNAGRLAVTSGGTIPDRGLYGAFLAGADGGGRPTRVGELDEEMVFESRVGDVFVLGSTSWRIDTITHDRVLVTPAPGQPGRLPFWKGDAVGRSAELGAAIGAFTRELADTDEAEAVSRCERIGLGATAATNLVGYLDEQRRATGELPTDQTLVVERGTDESGDWRVLLHSPFGLAVHSPWALALDARLRERYGVNAKATASDDGIVIRLPQADADPPGPEAFVFDPEEIEDLVTREVGGSALFAARFRECAARALLLPRRAGPDRRNALWQQRQRSAQLLEVVHRYPDFPIVLEAMRECLRDVYDVPALRQLLADIAARRIRLVETQTQTPSPFAQSLLFGQFGYVAEFLYGGDSPLAERRAAALSIDSSLLTELLGRAELRELLDAEAIDEVEAELQRLAPDRQVRDLEGVADLLREVGPMTADDVRERARTPEAVTGWLAELAAADRAVEIAWRDSTVWAAVEDVGRLRDALGAPVPDGVPDPFLEPVADPVGDVVSRFARTHGPFTRHDAADLLGLGLAVVDETLRRLAVEGRVVDGEFRPGGSGTEWCDTGVLRRLRSRSLARLRRDVEPVEPRTLARFLPVWQHVDSGLRGADGVLAVVEQLAGFPVPTSALESLVLASRVRDYAPAMLDELTAAGEVLWSGSGALPGGDGWVSLHPTESAPLTLPQSTAADGDLHRQIVDALSPGGAFFFRQLADAIGATDDDAMHQALWDLVWAGRLTNDTLAPLRALVGSGGTHRPRRSPPRTRVYGRSGPPRPRLPTRTGPPTAAGRWSLLPPVEPDPTRRAFAAAEALLDRHGVVTRGAVGAERLPGGFAAVYPVLRGFEESARCRRGYFVGSLGAAQFGSSGAVDRLRALTTSDSAGPQADGARSDAVVLAATDPANPYGAALPWPDRPDAGGHRPGRKAGALVVLVDGDLVTYVERGGRSLLTFTDDADGIETAFEALADAVGRGLLDQLTVHVADGEPALGSGLGSRLEAVGFRPTPKGLRLRG